MKTISLYSGELVFIDDEDLVLVAQHKRYASRTKRGHIYATTTIDGKWVGMHRLITGAGKGVLVDHHNGHGLDNRRRNLRLCTYGQNRANSVNDRKLPKGVYARRQRTGGTVYRAQIRHAKHLTNLGTYTTIEEAAAAYVKAAPIFHGEFARTE